jgi:polyisoprenoid-binding protein YceI
MASRTFAVGALLAASMILAAPGTEAQQAPAMPTSPPGTADPAAVQAGSYVTDPSHTLVGWRVNHFGFNDYFGQFGNIAGTLTLDPANLSAAAVDISVPVSGLSTASAELTEHMQRADFFDMAAHPTVRFVSTRVEPHSANGARITGDLTIRGVTRPVTLETRFIGAGINPFNRKASVGFHATTTIRRSEWGMGYGVPLVTDEVQLIISVAFERQA